MTRRAVRVLSIFVVVAVVIFSASFGLAELLGLGSVEPLREELRELPKPMTALVIGCLLASDIVFPVPATPLFVLSGALLGPVIGGLANSLGAVAGSVIGFAIGRRGGRAAMRRHVSDREVERSTRWMQGLGTLAIVLGRAAPMAPEILALLAGVSPMTWRRFVAATLIGTVPLAVVSAWAGANSDDRPGVAVFFGFVLPGLCWAALGLIVLLRRTVADPPQDM